MQFDWALNSPDHYMVVMLCVTSPPSIHLENGYIHNVAELVGLRQVQNSFVPDEDAVEKSYAAVICSSTKSATYMKP